MLSGLLNIIWGCLLFGIALVLCFTIIGILFAGPLFAASFACFASGFAKLALSVAKAAKIDNR